MTSRLAFIFSVIIISFNQRDVLSETITCASGGSCSNSCTGNDDCVFICEDCEAMTLHCGDPNQNGRCTVHCRDSRGCKSTIIQADSATDLTVNCGRTEDTVTTQCKNATIHCPTAPSGQNTCDVSCLKKQSCIVAHLFALTANTQFQCSDNDGGANCAKLVVHTLAPTSSPTAGPTQSTGAPSVDPSAAPTPMPSGIPSAMPSESPTQQPSHATGSPTAIPSAHPSATPSLDPTDMPSSATAGPSTHPSVHPSADPTAYPSLFPTIFPTVFPSAVPSVFPTTNPTAYPTSYPTSNPTMFPTVFPSHSPTQMDDNSDGASRQSKSRTLDALNMDTIVLVVAIGGIVVGLAVLIMLSIMCVYCYLKKHRQDMQIEDTAVVNVNVGRVNTRSDSVHSGNSTGGQYNNNTNNNNNNGALLPSQYNASAAASAIVNNGSGHSPPQSGNKGSIPLPMGIQMQSISPSTVVQSHHYNILAPIPASPQSHSTDMMRMQIIHTQQQPRSANASEKAQELAETETEAVIPAVPHIVDGNTQDLESLMSFGGYLNSTHSHTRSNTGNMNTSTASQEASNVNTNWNRNMSVIAMDEPLPPPRNTAGLVVKEEGGYGGR